MIATALLALCSLASAQETLPMQVTPGPPRHASASVPADVTLRFDRAVPSTVQVVRLARGDDRAWHLAETFDADATNGLITARGPSGVDSLLLIRASGQPGYLLDGPFRWPSKPSIYSVPVEWLRTLRGRMRAGRSPLTFVADDGGARRGVTCEWISDIDWECVGVPLAVSGAVVAQTTGRVLSAIPGGQLSATGVENAVTLSSLWGRLVIVSAAAASQAPPRIAARRLHVSSVRSASTRFETMRDDRVRIVPVGGRAAWISGNAPVDTGWLEVSAVGSATERPEMADVANGPADVPIAIHLSPSTRLFGRVLRPGDHVVRDAIVTLYRFAGERREGVERRITIAETRTDVDGLYAFDDLSPEQYEIVAFHEVAGRATRRVVPDGRETDLTLRGGGVITGRVLRDGLPAGGIDVAVVPDLAQVARAGDITELRGGSARTQEDGRFAVTMGAKGAGELRVGDERLGVRRIPLSPADGRTGVMDVGDISLDVLPPVTFVFEGAGACELLLTGPAGRTGLSIVRASRLGPAMFQAPLPEPGRWHIVSVCDSRERAVVPGIVNVTTADRDRTIRIAWPQ